VIAICFQVKSELPSTLKAYRSQQHRWSCGPALLFKKMFWEILAAKVSLVHQHAPWNSESDIKILSYVIIWPYVLFSCAESVSLQEVVYDLWLLHCPEDHRNLLHILLFQLPNSSKHSITRSADTEIPVWELIYIPTAITLLNSVGSPRLAWC
jgi:beta-mannan synthase